MPNAKAKPKSQAVSKPVPIVREAVTRIVKHTVKLNERKIPAKSFATRVDAAVQRREAAKLQVVKPARLPVRAPLVAQVRAGRAGRTGS